MIRSLTGFGRATSENEQTSFSVEIRSVNNRYLEITSRLPRGMGAWEKEVQALLRGRLERGKVNLFVQEQRDPSARAALNLDAEAAGGLLASLRELGQATGVEDDLSLSDLLPLVDRLDRGEDEGEAKARLELLLEGTKKAVADLERMQEEEGANLERDFRERLAGLSQFIDAVELRAEQHRAGALERLRERIEKYVPSEKVDEGRLEQEVAYLVDRLDITEELVRFRSHIDLFASALDEGGFVGKRLNFILQEMNREVNTIGSKSNDADIAKRVVEAKEELEKIREQVQNVA